jgi:hypothetical protein
MSTAPGSAVVTAPVATPQAGGVQVELPNEKVLSHAAKIAMEQDKPILLDYYTDTKLGRAFLGEDGATKEKILVKNPEEYTSPVQKMFKAKDDYIIVTENSVYIVSGLIKRKTISSASMT